MPRKKEVEVKEENKKEVKEIPTLLLTNERDIALDFATKVYKKFDKLIKSIVLFGSSAKKLAVLTSDIDIVIIIDDVSVRWDMELISWYREELAKIVKENPYKKEIHVNTIKLSTWWEDLRRGDPVVLNVIRFGDPLIDIGGFFTPLKILLQEGKIIPTPEAIYTLLQRAPTHIYRTRTSLLAAVDGIYWACVDSAHAALIAYNVFPPSPEHIADTLKETFVDRGKLKGKWVDFFEEVHSIAKDIVHGKIKNIEGRKIDEMAENADYFISEMARLVDEGVK